MSMIEINPYELEWPLMKARILGYDMDCESAMKVFEVSLLKDPFRVEVYHSLVIMSYASRSKLTELETRISEAIERSKKEKKAKEMQR